MRTSLSILAALTALGAGSADAQQQEAALRQVELPGAGFNIVLATPKSPAATIDLGESPDALIIHLTGGELALAFEDGGEMLEAIDALQRPACAFQAQGRDGKSTKPVAVYVVPALQMPASIGTSSVDARLQVPVMRKVEVPGNDFDIVFTTTKTPIVWEPHDQSVIVYPTGEELIMATDDDIKRMFKEVGLSQWPTCAFHVEHKGSRPSQAASVYIIPEGETTASPSR
jgi:hypothetical protein